MGGRPKISTPAAAPTPTSNQVRQSGRNKLAFNSLFKDNSSASKALLRAASFQANQTSSGNLQ